MRNRILLIEDDPDASSLLQKMLTKAGYDVRVLFEGRDILDGKFEIPDLFILDNKLPNIEGVALCKFLRLKPATQDIPVIIISGNDEMEGRSSIAGANYFLPKPLDINRLLLMIRNCVPRPSVEEITEWDL